MQDKLITEALQENWTHTPKPNENPWVIPPVLLHSILFPIYSFKAQLCQAEQQMMQVVFTCGAMGAGKSHVIGSSTTLALLGPIPATNEICPPHLL
jgi:hypothetical protein